MSTNSYWNKGTDGAPQRVDHAGWAMEFVRAAENAFDGDVTITPREEPTVAENIALAQVHATLALVEQQRIANLIAVWNGPGDAIQALGEVGMSFEAVRDAIREGLGL